MRYRLAEAYVACMRPLTRFNLKVVKYLLRERSKRNPL